MKTTIEKSGGEVIGSYENSLFFIKKTGNTAYAISKISLAFSGTQIDIRTAKTIQTLTSVDTPVILSFNSTDGLSGISIGKDTILFDAKNESILSLNIPSQNQLKNISRYGDVFILSTDHGAIIAR